MRILKTTIPAILVFITFMLLAISPGRTDWLDFSNNNKYKADWAKVKSLEKKGLPKSALEVIDQIYSSAKTTNNHEQLVKALIYRAKFISATETDAFPIIIKAIEDEIKASKFPSKQLLHSYAAGYYWSFYSRDAWKINQRGIIPGFQSEDVFDWDKMDFVTKVKEHLLASLENDENLKKVKISDFEDIISEGSKPSEFRPTLYDFLGHRLITQLSGTMHNQASISDNELLSDKHLFDLDLTIKEKIELNNKSNSSHFLILKQYHDLLRHNAKVANTPALIDSYLSYLNYLRTNSNSALKEELYIKHLRLFRQQQQGMAFEEEIAYMEAEYLLSEGDKFNHADTSTYIYKDYKIKTANLLKTIIENHATSHAAKNSEVLLKKLKSTSLRFDAEKAVIPNKAAPIQFTFKNLKEIYLTIFKVDTAEYFAAIKKKSQMKLVKKLTHNKNIVATQKIEIPTETDYNTHVFKYLMEPLPIGKYIIIASTDEKLNLNEDDLAWQFINASNLAYFERDDRHKGCNVFHVVNRKTGFPIKAVDVAIYKFRYDRKKRESIMFHYASAQSDASGYFEVPKNKSNSPNDYLIVLRKGKDYLIPNEHIYHSYKAGEYENTTCNLFIDRKIYRPGQTVYYKGIVHKGRDANAKVLKGINSDANLIDVNWQTVKTNQHISNEFGSFTGSFVLPKSALTGSYQIRCQHGNIQFNVEEYKRPKITVEMLPIEGQYRFNDSVTVKGQVRSFTGHPAAFASLTYNVQKSATYGWYKHSRFTPESQITTGNVRANAKGEFSITFKALCPDNVATLPNQQFTYSVNVDASDQSGETVSSSQQVIIKSAALYFDVDIPNEIDQSKGAMNFNLAVKTVNQQIIDTLVSIEIFKLIEPELLYPSKFAEGTDIDIFSEEKWKSLAPLEVYKDELETKNLKIEKRIKQIDYHTGDEKELNPGDYTEWESGHYLFSCTTADQWGNKINSKFYTELYNSGSSELPSPKTSWFVPIKRTAEPGEKAIYLIGSSLSKCKVLYELGHKNEIILRKWITLKNEQQLIEIPIEEQHRGGMNVSFTFVSNNHIARYGDLIEIPFTNKELDISFETFRDHLYPGAKEEWRIKIKNHKAEPVLAELLCSMYDASLDEFASNDWSKIFRPMYISLPGITKNTFELSSSSSPYRNRNFGYTQNLTYDQLIWFAYNQMSSIETVASAGRGTPMLARFSAKNDRMMLDEESADDGVSRKQIAEHNLIPKLKAPDGAFPKGESILNNSQVDLGTVKTRTNFNETAFFYPHLKTNADGEVIVAFTVPESLTKWNINGLAHMPDLSSGMFQKELITKKELMAEANPPRFFRENDKMQFPVKISNLTDKAVNGIIELQFFNSLTMELIKIAKENSKLEFKIDKQGIAVLKWEINIPEGVQAISYELRASTGTFTDGEERIIPVLSNRMLVTESLPISIREKGTKTYQLNKLLASAKSSTLKHHKLTLEFTQNPAWYAVQALPYLMEYPHECAEQLFSRFYANQLASHIVQSQPSIKKVFDTWKLGDNSETFLSNLDKNEELKYIILNETPWVKDAISEREQKQNLALLFDLNKMSDEKELALQKLMKNQNPDGSWSWFPGLSSNRYITQHIVAGLGHLAHLGVIDFSKNNELSNTLAQAIAFIDEQMYKDYLRAIRPLNKSDHQLSSFMVHYLYTRSFFDEHQLSQLHSVAFNHFQNRAEKEWLKFNKYEQGMIALALSRNGDSETPAAIIESLKEYAQYSEEFGMYWKQSNGYYWNEAPIEQQALMIELFEEVAKDAMAVNELKVWLLKQKQTQAWKTTKATANAVYALLLSGDNWLVSDEQVIISVGDQTLDPKNDPELKTEAGSGYFSKSWSAKEIKPGMGKVTVKKQSDQLSWGALYWQYFEDLDKITTSDAGLQLTKELYVERRSGEKTELIKITKETPAVIGDKIIVRINIKSDRNLEFVHLKDMRASGLEPLQVLSGHRYKNGMSYYESIRDAAVNFYFDYLPTGNYVFEYPLRVVHSGDFSNGISTIQCMYAPEFTAHSRGVNLKLKE